MKAPLGTTFIVAASLLGVAAVAQLVAVLVYFGPGFKQSYSATAAELSVPTAAPAAAAAVPQAPPAETAAQKDRVAELTADADKLEASAAPADALAPLQEALTLRPTDAGLMARIASLHERLGQNEAAAAAWQKLVQLGPGAGNLFEVAEVRLNLLNNPEPEGGNFAVRDQTGLQPGSSLGVVDLKVADAGDASNPIKDLRLAVKARPGEQIDGRDVRINVTFYETMNDEIIPTMSRVQSMWFTSPVDWRSDGLEILEVKYEVPRIGPDGGPPPEYYGYMVNIYHKGQLQETRAEPADLQELFPPPLNEAPAGTEEDTSGGLR